MTPEPPVDASAEQDAPLWRYDHEGLTAPEVRFDDDETRDERNLWLAWRQLQVLHAPYREIKATESRWIVDWLNDLERLFRDTADLESYYYECFAPEEPRRRGAPVPPDSVRIAHVAASQVRFMEQVFYTLELQRYPNAPDNRGWMNLFRRWGRSPTFNARLNDMISLVSHAFLDFYDLYLRFQPHTIDEAPVPHPWDPEIYRRVADDPDRVMAGVFLDSGVREVTLPPEGEEPPEQPTEGHFGVPPTPRAPGSWEPPPSGDDGESGASASSHPNE